MENYTYFDDFLIELKTHSQTLDLTCDDVKKMFNQKLDWSSCKPFIKGNRTDRHYNCDCHTDNYRILNNVSFSEEEKAKHERIVSTLMSALNEESDEKIMEYVSSNGLLLRFVPPERKTYDMCIAACQHCPWSLQFTDEFQDEVMCYIVIMNQPELFRYVKNQTDILISRILKYRPSLFEYVKNQTPELCEYALKCGAPLRTIKEKTPALIALACALNLGEIYNL